MKSVFFLFFYAFANTLHGQATKSTINFIKNIPTMSATSSQAYTWHFGKEKLSPWYLQEQEIDQIIVDFYDRSKHESYQLFLLASTHKLMRQPDFANGNPPKDATLDTLTRNTWKAIQLVFDKQLRINNDLANESFKKLKMVDAMDQQLINSKRLLATMAGVFQKEMQPVYAYLKKKNWNVQQDKNPYWIQIMETEALFLDQWRFVLSVVRGTQEYASRVFESCRDHHEGCE